MWLIAVMLVALSGLAMASSYSFSGYVAGLLLAALGVVVYRLARGPGSEQ